MLSVGLFLSNDAMPRTAFYEKLRQTVMASPRFSAQDARLFLPDEDTAVETNWPRYGAVGSAYVRHREHDLTPSGPYQPYMNAVMGLAKQHSEISILLVNMHPGIRLPLQLRRFPNIMIADGNLAGFERALNPRTISMPALPFVTGTRTDTGVRPLLASFQGVNSHPVRQAMAEHAEEEGFAIHFVGTANHHGKIDVTQGATDQTYEQLLDQSNFAFVPRGDEMFSYRLLEVMARGAIPIILSDGWVLPLDRSIDWDAISLRFAHDAVPKIPNVLRSIDPATIAAMRVRVIDTYARHLSSLDVIFETVMAECERIIYAYGQS